MSAPARKSYLLGLIGLGIGGSRSPFLHESEAAAHGLPLVYRLLDMAQLQPGIANLATLLGIVRALGFDGVNVTHPFKREIVPLLDELSDEATALGAVNTVVIRNGRSIGHNTDWSGFAAAMSAGLPDVSLRKVTQLGAGGAGAATAYALLKLGTWQLTVYDANAARANELSTRLQALFPDRDITTASDAAVALRGAHGLVQATPVGMIGHAGSPIAPQLLDSSLWVADIIYTPAETALLAEARKLGCRTINGSGMVIAQAANALRLFTGIEPDIERMRRSFETKASDPASVSAS